MDDSPALSTPSVARAFAWASFSRELRFHEAARPGFTLELTRRALADDAITQLCPEPLFEAGRMLFEHTFSRADGLGNAVNPTGRASPLRRVHGGRFGGPDTVGCTSCHWRGGVGGAGAVTDNSFILGDGDAVDSADARNPPSLVGVGLVQLLAAEMTEELAAQRDGALARARETRAAVTVQLVAKEISFGALIARPDGSVDTSAVEGIDADLVVRPFGWKGTFVDLTSFIEESLQVHLGIQGDDLLADHDGDAELLGPGPASDPDQDGVTREFTGGQLQALVAFLALLDTPVVRPPETLPDLGPAAEHLRPPPQLVYTDQWIAGRALFHGAGCANCHVPSLVLKNPVLTIRSPATGVEITLDLSRHGIGPRPTYDPVAGGYAVWAFSDFKRHDLGEGTAARHVDHGVAPTVYLTRRLWGLAQSPPYFYDGRAPSLDAAIEAHGGDGAESRDAFAALSFPDKAALRVYLMSLRRERRPLVP